MTIVLKQDSVKFTVFRFGVHADRNNVRVP